MEEDESGGEGGEFRSNGTTRHGCLWMRLRIIRNELMVSLHPRQSRLRAFRGTKTAAHGREPANRLGSNTDGTQHRCVPASMQDPEDHGQYVPFRGNPYSRRPLWGV